MIYLIYAAGFIVTALWADYMMSRACEERGMAYDWFGVMTLAILWPIVPIIALFVMGEDSDGE